MITVNRRESEHCENPVSSNGILESIVIIFTVQVVVELNDGDHQNEKITDTTVLKDGDVVEIRSICMGGGSF